MATKDKQIGIRITALLSRCLGLLVFLLPWQTIWIISEPTLNGSKWQYGTQGLYIIELFLWMTALLFIVWFWKQAKGRISLKEIKPTKDRLFLLTSFLFIAYLYISAFWAPVPEVAIQQAQRILGGFVLFLMLFLGPLTAKRAMVWFVAGAVLQSVFGIWQFMFQTTVASVMLGLSAHVPAQPGSSVIVNDYGRWLRAYGAFPHPNIFGGYLVCAIVAARTLFSMHKDIRVPLQTLLYVLLGSALFATGSRSAWLGLGILLLFEYYKFRKKNKQSAVLLKTVVITSVILSFFFFPLLSTRLTGGSVHEAASTGERLKSIPEAIDLLSEARLLGVGAGNYTAALFAVDESLPGWKYQPVHNIDLLLFVELGAIGLALGVLAAFYFMETWILIHGQKKVWVLGLVILCMVPMALFDHYFWTSWAGIMIFASFFGIMLRKDGYLSTV